MSDPTEEAKWRAEFERLGETDVRDGLKMMSPEPKRQFAFGWLRDREKDRNIRDKRTYEYVRCTFWAAVAAVIVGIIGVAVTLIADVHFGSRFEADNTRKKAKRPAVRRVSVLSLYGGVLIARSIPTVPAVAHIDMAPATPSVDPAPAAAMVVVDVWVHVPVAAVDEGHAVKTVNAVEPDKAHTAMEAGEAHAAMADEVAATKTANGESTATEAMAADRMSAEAMATTAAATKTAGVGGLWQCDDHGNKHCKHQIEQLASHDTLLFGRFSPVAKDVPRS
jgi:hypothetical protein